MKMALYYECSGENTKCLLCPHGCELTPGQTGICQARQNMYGEMVSLNYGRMTALAIDPIEKKPLRQFYPGSMILSYGSFGCNLQCPFCQNWRISKEKPESEVIAPQQLVDLALAHVKDGNIGIAFTYNEPLVGYEFVYDCAQLAREAELKTVLVTNGYIRLEPLMRLLPFIDAMNIDLKGSPEFYDTLCHGQQAYVKQAIMLSVRRCHVEVTMLVVPAQNDAHDGVDAIASWIAEISPDIPLHLTRYHPEYKMDTPAQAPEKLYALAETARKHLNYVYCGNI